jgi:hypothetical protein
VSSLTNVSLPPDLYEPVRAAAEHYGFDTMAAFFRMAARALIRQHQQGDNLALPLTFDRTENHEHGTKTFPAVIRD